MEPRKVLVCVAWPYANGPLHLGHLAGSIMPADIFARYQRLIGNRVLMVSGSDMHGAPIAVRADREGKTPEEIAFRYHEVNRKAILDMGMSFDLYTHTHTENHSRTVQEIFLSLLGNGYLERRTGPQYYCSSCERFLPDRYVEGVCPFCGNEKARGDQCDRCGKALNAEELRSARCQLCSSTPHLRDTEHFFFRLADFSDRLREYVRDKEHWRPKVRTFTLNILDEGLQDRAITRDLAWGIPVPVEGFEGKRIYVWFEAVIGYLSASKEWAGHTGDPARWEQFWKDPACKSYYFLGKDNIIFHTIIWPAILIGYGGLNLPHDVPANEFMNLEGQKFSKSAGISIDIPSMLERFQPDAIRYYLSTNMPELKDTEFSWEEFVAKVNNELVAAYGNFVHRALSFTFKNFGEIPSGDGARDDWKETVSRHISEARESFQESVERCNLKSGLKAVMELARFGNQFFDSSEPWALLRKDKELCGAALKLSLEIVKSLAIMTSPYLPHSSAEVWRYLGFGEASEGPSWAYLDRQLPVGQKLHQPRTIFRKIDLKVEEEKGFAGFRKLNLKIGRIRGVSDHPKADKLYVLSVDIGKEITLVAGLKGHYAPEDLLEKLVVVVSNLEPATLRGVKSEGMLLAAESEDVVSLLRPSRSVDVGTQVSSGLLQSDRRISFQEFQKLRLVVGSIEAGRVNSGERYVDCRNCDLGDETRLAALFLEDDRAIALRCSDGTPVTVDREVPAGAKIR